MSRTIVFSATVGTLALLVAAGAPTARARQEGSGGDAARAQKVQYLLEARANKQARNLGLTPDQTQQIVQINSNALKQLQALKANPPADRMEAAKALRSIIDTRKAALGQLFTPEQMKKYTATNQKDAASLMTLSLDSALNLTNDQMKNTDKVNLAYIQKASAALNLSDKTEAVRALTMAQNDYDSALQKILTPDQWKQYQALIAADDKQQQQ